MAKENTYKNLYQHKDFFLNDKICSQLKGNKHVKNTRIAPTSLKIGTEQQNQFKQQNKIKTSRTRDHVQYVPTTLTHLLHNHKQIQTPISKQIPLNWTRII